MDVSKDLELIPLRLLVLQPTTACNIDCSYCYLPDRRENRVMDLDTLSKAVSLITADDLSNGSFSVVFHSGEPLIVGTSFFEASIREISSVNGGRDQIRFNVQTNGMLITKEWCDLFKRFNVNVGVSIDGPKDVHDHFRRGWSGLGSWDKTMAGIRCLRENGVEFHTISVLTSRSLERPEEIWRFLRSLEPSRICFNVEEEEGVNQSSLFRHGRSIHNAYREFMGTLLKICLDNDEVQLVREFSHMFERLPALQFESRDQRINDQTRPFGILSIDTVGNFSTFSPELLGTPNMTYANFVLGNVHSTTFREALKAEPFVSMMHNIEEGVRNCRQSCQYFNICEGGAPSNKVFENGSFSSTETTFCQLTKQALADVVIETVENCVME